MTWSSQAVNHAVMHSRLSQPKPAWRQCLHRLQALYVHMKAAPRQEVAVSSWLQVDDLRQQLEVAQQDASHAESKVGILQLQL